MVNESRWEELKQELDDQYGDKIAEYMISLLKGEEITPEIKDRCLSDINDNRVNIHTFFVDILVNNFSTHKLDAEGTKVTRILVKMFEGRENDLLELADRVALVLIDLMHSNENIENDIRGVFRKSFLVFTKYTFFRNPRIIEWILDEYKTQLRYVLNWYCGEADNIDIFDGIDDLIITPEMASNVTKNIYMIK